MNKDKIESKNKLDALIYQTKSSVNNDEIKSKLEESDITLVNDLLNETELWLEEEDHSKEDYDNKLTEVNGKLNPVMMKVYSEGGGGMPESVPMSSVPEESDKPTIDEVD